MSSSDDGSKTKRAILDTNVIYSALHNPAGVCGRIVLLGTTPSVELYSIDLAREELRINLERNMDLSRGEVEFVISSLPVSWIPREVYSHNLKRAVKIVGIPQDAAFVAASFATGIPLVTGDKHLRTLRVRRLVKTYAPRDFAELLRVMT